MTRLFLLALTLAAAALAGCGAAGCSSAPAPINQGAVTNGCSSLAAGSAVTINAPLCPPCTDTSPACAGEVVGGNTIEISPTVQQCSDNSNCDAQGCSVPGVTCTVSQSLTAGTTYTIQYLLPGDAFGTETVTASAGGPTSCSL